MKRFWILTPLPLHFLKSKILIPKSKIKMAVIEQ